MQIRIEIDGPDHTTTTLAEPDVFAAFDVVGQLPSHVWVRPETLVVLAGERADDQRWREQLDAMIAYASSKGWTDADGRSRAHVAEQRS